MASFAFKRAGPGMPFNLSRETGKKMQLNITTLFFIRSYAYIFAKQKSISKHLSQCCKLVVSLYVPRLD